MTWTQVTILCPADYEDCLENLFRQIRVGSFHSAKVAGYCSHPNFFTESWKDSQIKLQCLVDSEQWLSIKVEIQQLRQKGQLAEGVVYTRSVDEVIYLNSEHNSEAGNDEPYKK